jgi:NADP-dependent 3-hydroxy acid dehydrogenase YdfG
MKDLDMSNPPVILVTGASSGIGEATARLFGEKSYRVVLAARRFERLEILSRTIRERGGQALPVAADLSRLEDIQNLVATAIEEFGQIDVLFNNAGFGRLAWLEELDPVKDIDAQLQVNLNGVIQATRAVLPHMIQRRSGHIVNMASIAAFVGTPTYSIYAAGKFAVRGFSEALRREVGVYGIRVTVVYPGSVKTEFGEHTGAKEKGRRSTPASLKLTPEQVAQAVFDVIRRPRRMVVLPWVMNFPIWWNILFPGLSDWLIERNFTRRERG